ncbi:tRNA uridine(34) 5-carboxymethylaminomethyl modification radical SAM/GNAT enzyme Elp3 [Methanohalophilus portucalensis]|uniref:tRNA carboxymethyluridine synthase n=2 Tax=Methanohalophilus portucalensis TaxID=39664 RepID=A0A1L9C5D4_9EURY|nr:tRNA uridine(34) 5-carboxymethylaminomethyl modification radical SAM/GNAT enzyme Elp3 [Methanohalophilus portucalensis]ATU08362.1 tRNA uridine(34) 5-carboxymethylaminomethyl modification radical SAM/GNAT enzyme Elp3 [Methanohalophilus portucalensis]OJH49691.1 histone acetyltransferase [Methanohalophilus portucalensis FDF-1]RNI13473.1 tRNA uridine(34) 5-carboxymethylaminomethyl modification radical SAM/GNAT enzyme Elp3 [Methanohalophilus portucalensis FDF-1]SMH34527.1 elongator complex protei
MSDEDDFAQACRKLVELVLDDSTLDKVQFNREKLNISRQYGLSTLPRNSDVIAAASDGEKEFVRSRLRRKPVRTISGVAVIAVMTSPAPCPHGVCVPCPGGPASAFESPQSYMGREPAAMRGIQYEYDPYRIVHARLKQLQEIGHEVDKAELIVMGGTFTSRNMDYQEWFTKRCLEAMNDFKGHQWRDSVHNVYGYIPIEDVQEASESSAVRNIGITYETRPDWTSPVEVDRLLDFGATKVEIGVQSVYDFVLSRMRRGHTVADTAEANRILRDSGLKVGFHMMPRLPGSDNERDLRGFKKLFNDSRFMPDFLKIYPTLVTEGTELEKMWRAGKYDPLYDEEAVELLADIKAILPKWVRLQRIQRDIPAQQILAGVKKSNIRQLAGQRLMQKGGKCNCIRCREVGHNILKERPPSIKDIEFMVQSYSSCGGQEHFLSFEDVSQDILIGFLRLRFPNKPHRPELDNSALVRELHVYGSMVVVGGSAKDHDWQHRGYGLRLISEAENMAKDAGFEKLSIISGIGVREYYRKLGYVLEGPYMTKYL